MKLFGLWFNDLGSKLLAGCQVAVWMFLIPWVITAIFVWLFPSFSYGLVERWVCPANSLIQVEGTEGWLTAVLNDDESVDFPQITCVSSQGAVVLRGDSSDNLTAYLRVFGVVLLCILSIGIIVFAYKAINRQFQRGVESL